MHPRDYSHVSSRLLAPIGRFWLVQQQRPGDLQCSYPISLPVFTTSVDNGRRYGDCIKFDQSCCDAYADFIWITTSSCCLLSIHVNSIDSGFASTYRTFPLQSIIVNIFWCLL